MSNKIISTVLNGTPVIVDVSSDLGSFMEMSYKRIFALVSYTRKVRQLGFCNSVEEFDQRLAILNREFLSNDGQIFTKGILVTEESSSLTHKTVLVSFIPEQRAPINCRLEFIMESTAVNSDNPQEHQNAANHV